VTGCTNQGPAGALIPALRNALVEDKTSILRLLTAPAPDALVDDPCPICGSRERWQWLDGRLL
jgi:hypothetical protein